MALDNLQICSGSEYSNIPYNSSRKTLIDHMVIAEHDLPSVCKCSIVEDNAIDFSTHRPLLCEIISQTHTSHNHPIKVSNSYAINWRTLKQRSILNYKQYLGNDDQLLKSILKGKTISSHSEIDDLYHNIIPSVHRVTEKHIPKPKYKPFIKPYWNSTLTKLHKDMNMKRKMWLSENRPRGRDSPSCNNYKIAKNTFRQFH